MSAVLIALTVIAGAQVTKTSECDALDGELDKAERALVRDDLAAIGASVKALAKLKACIRKAPSDEQLRALWVLGDICLRTEQWSCAANNYDRIINNSKGHAVRYNLGRASVLGRFRVDLARAGWPGSGGGALTGECFSEQKDRGKLRALLIGISDYGGKYDLAGPVNDTRLMKSALSQDTTSKPRITTLTDKRATRMGVVKALSKLTKEVGCGDFVVILFSGHAGRLEETPYGWGTQLILAEGKKDKRRHLFGAELSEVVTAIRNRGASVAVVIDTVGAAGLGIGYFQELAAGPSSWRVRVGPDGVRRAQRTEEAIVTERYLTQLSPGAGDFSAWYGATENGFAMDGAKGPGGQTYGWFTYVVARSLLGANELTVATLAERVSAGVKDLPDGGNRARFLFESSAPKARVLRPATAGATRGEALAVEILSPRLSTRGAGVVESQTFELVGQLKNPQQIKQLSVENRQVDVQADGRFMAKVELELGKNEILLSGIDRKLRFHTRTIELVYENELQAIAKTGRRYAVLIGVQNYKDPKLRDLRTPRADVKALARVLEKNYGFETKVDLPGELVGDFVLLDPTRKQITDAFTNVRGVLQEQDTLLVYFAGHGQFIQQSGQAYWLAIDAVHDDEWSWLSADQLRNYVRTTPARNVLVVADSCFSGAMNREAPKLIDLDKDRERALIKAGRKRSRIFISSGGVEPVLDEGGSGHSIFARAFLTGLERMDRPLFSSGELYDRFILPKVSGNARQEPTRREIRDSGHDGGDVIFVRKK